MAIPAPGLVRRRIVGLSRMAAAIWIAGACVPRSAPGRDLEVRFHNGDVVLAGTLTLPGGRARGWPVAVFVSGDGPQDREGSPGATGLFRLLADSLVAHGIAALRHDDRGAGRSSSPSTPPSYRALLDDTRAAVAFVRGRSGIDPRRVVLVGHSEGAKTCQVLASEDTAIAGIALLAGATAVNVDSLLEEQARLDPDGPAPRLLPTLERARAGGRAEGPGDLTDWMREHLEIAPRAVLPKVRCPVLILAGEEDHLVRPYHANEAAGLVRSGGNRDVIVRVFPGLSHAFTRATPSAAGTADPAVAGALARWASRVVVR